MYDDVVQVAPVGAYLEFKNPSRITWYYGTGERAHRLRCRLPSPFRPVGDYRPLGLRSDRERGHQHEIALADEKMNGDGLLTNCYRGIEE